MAGNHKLAVTTTACFHNTLPAYTCEGVDVLFPLVGVTAVVDIQLTQQSRVKKAAAVPVTGNTVWVSAGGLFSASSARLHSLDIVIHDQTKNSKLLVPWQKQADGKGTPKSALRFPSCFLEPNKRSLTILLEL